MFSPYDMQYIRLLSSTTARKRNNTRRDSWYLVNIGLGDIRE
jgi:hypothetical protein